MRGKSFGLPVVTLTALEIGPVKPLKFCTLQTGPPLYFLDMVLPQLVPMHTRWDDATKSLLRCHLLRLHRGDRQDVEAHVTCTVQYLFTSWADTYMTAIYWTKPLLLFSDVENVRLDPMEVFQSAESSTPNKRRVQMGLPDGHSILSYYHVRGTQYQAILLSMSALPRRKAKL